MRESSGAICCEGSGAAPCPCAPWAGGWMSPKRISLEVTPAPPGLCSPEPRQLLKMLSAGDMIIPGGDNGERFMAWGFFRLRKEK